MDMDVSKEISVDIIRYLQEKKGLSIDDIAKSMSTSFTHIQEVINKKSNLRSENINFYLKNKNIKFWEFAIDAIPSDHISPKSKRKILICKKLSDHIKKNKKKT